MAGPGPPTRCPSPSRAPSSRSSRDVSCLKATDCVAIGAFNGKTPWSTVAAFFNGKKWTVHTLPGMDVLLGSINCASANSCLAVSVQGDDVYGDGGEPYAESWNGKSWKGTGVPAPPVGGQGTALNDAACPSAAYCVAVGQSVSASLVHVGFSDIWNGRTWKPVPGV
jgi:hypothetical protein